MSVKNRVSLKATKRLKLTAGLRFCFAAGADPLGELGIGLTGARLEMRLRELWEVYRETAMAHWLANEEPFTRPQIWWDVDAPESRPEIIWTDPSDYYAADRALRRAKEIDILVRHGLLTKAERKLIAKQPPFAKWLY